MQTHKRLTSEQRKRVILRAAIDVFSESNYHIAKISEISKRSGVTDPMIYKFFNSKKELFLEILHITSEKTLNSYLVQEVTTTTHLTSKYLIRKEIVDSLWGYFDSMEKYRKELKIYYQAISEIDDPDIEKVLHRSYRKYASFFESIIQHGIDSQLIFPLLSANALAWDIVGFCIQQSTLFIMGFYNEQVLHTLLSQRVKMWIP